MIKLMTGLLLILITPLAMAATQTVKMKSISFDPKMISIKVGDSVEWKNESYTPHSATADESVAPAEAFDTGLIEPKKTSRKVKFGNTGTFRYHCSVHGHAMSAVVEVQP